MQKVNNLPQFFLDNYSEVDISKGSSNISAPLNILVMGKVSTGKSSLLNALLGKSRKNSPFKVRAESGVTQSLDTFQLNPYLCLIDTPGLDDINYHADFCNQPIDVGILVVEGSADGRQRSHLDRLRQHCGRVVVVLNKIDQFDKWQPFVLERLLQQWREALAIERIFPTCTFGFDPEVDFALQLDLRGIEELKAELEQMLKERWQERQRHVPVATLVGIISPTIRSIAEAGTVERRSPFIPGLLAIALAELYHQYYHRSLAGEQTYKLLQLCPQIGFCWQPEAANFLLDPDRLQTTLVDSLSLLLGAVQQWSRGAELQIQSLELLKPMIKAEIEPQLPSHWSKTIEMLLSRVLNLPC